MKPKIKPNYRIKTVKKRPSMLLRGVAIGATILALKFAPQFFAADARVAKINAEIAAQNKILAVERQKNPPMVPLEVRYKNGKREIFNPNEHGNCTAYVKRAAKKYFGKNYLGTAAWFLPEENKVVLSALSLAKIKIQG
ncbi:MAG: hypothetical protein NTZ73_00180 [Candidatus Diapherotrites archaeon]|nr:hypothetical protein [Candidatus Diapherotrites archaeon]